MNTANEITTRYNPKIPFTLIVILASSFLISLFVMEVVAVILLFLWLVEDKQSKKISFDSVAQLVFLFGAARVLSVIFSPFPDSAVPSLWKEALLYATIPPLFFYMRVLSDDYVAKIYTSYLAAATVVGIIGIVQFSMGWVDRAASVTSGYSTYSSYLLASFGLFFFLPYRRMDNAARLFLIIGLVVLFTGMILSLGRTNIAIAGAVLIAAFVFKRIPWKVFVAVAVLTFVTSYTILTVVENKEIDRRKENPAGVSDRNTLWYGAYLRAMERPLTGFGPRTFLDVFPLKEKLNDVKVGSWHNDFISVYMESGILGLTAFLSLLGYVYLRGLRVYSRIKIQRKYRERIFAALMGISALVLSGMTAGFISAPELSIVFAFMLALFSSGVYGAERSE